MLEFPKVECLYLSSFISFTLSLLFVQVSWPPSCFFPVCSRWPYQLLQCFVSCWFISLHFLLTPINWGRCPCTLSLVLEIFLSTITFTSRICCVVYLIVNSYVFHIIIWHVKPYNLKCVEMAFAVIQQCIINWTELLEIMQCNWTGGCTCGGWAGSESW